MITKSGAEYAYLQEAFSPLHQNLRPIPSFLFAWTSVLILKPALFGVISSFAVYVVQPFYGPCGSSDLIVKLIAVLCLFLITYINAYSVSLATKVQNFFTLMKLLAIAIIIGDGIYMLSKGFTEHLETGFEDTRNLPPWWPWHSMMVSGQMTDGITSCCNGAVWRDICIDTFLQFYCLVFLWSLNVIPDCSTMYTNRAHQTLQGAASCSNNSITVLGVSGGGANHSVWVVLYSTSICCLQEGVTWYRKSDTFSTDCTNGCTKQVCTSRINNNSILGFSNSTRSHV